MTGAAPVEVAPEVLRIPLGFRSHTNAYLVGDLLVDAGYRRHAPAVLAAVAGRPLRAHLVTHAHPDHAGGSRTVVEALGVPVWAGSGDAAAIEAGRTLVGDGRVRALIARGGRYPKLPVARRVEEGDDLAAGFVALRVPGHTLGQVALWREPDRTLLCADALFNLSIVSMTEGLREPPRLLTVDPGRARATIRRLAELDPQTVCFGHGPPLRSPERLREFAAGLA